MMENKKETISVKYPGEGMLNSLDTQIALVKKLEGVYKNRPNPEEFIGAMKGTNSEGEYTKEKIQEDIDYVKDIKEKIEKSNKEKGLEVLALLEGGFSLGEMMQAMIVDRINKGMFPHFKAIISSERDDLKVGIDAVLKRKEYGYLGASFDFTISSNKTTIQDKLEKNWKYNIEKHQIPTVKYFKDPDTKEMRPLMVPKFIIGGSKKDIEVFAQSYLDNKEEELNNHPFKYMMVKQINDQLKAALKFFEEKKDDRNFDFIARKYKEIKVFIEELKKDIGFEKFSNSKEFFEQKKNSVAYQSMKDFYSNK